MGALHRRFVAISMAVAALASAPGIAPADEPIDVSAFASELVVLRDRKGSVIVVHPMGERDRFFFGDGKVLYAQRSNHYFQDKGEGKESRGFWAPWAATVPGASAASLEIDLGTAGNLYSVRCGTAQIDYQEVSEEEKDQVLREATFLPPRWQREPVILARDEDGNYYLVDKLRDPYRKGYRMFIGRRGRMRELPIVDVVADSGGYIFATKKGDFTVARQEQTAFASWSKGKKKQTLTFVPIELNLRLIYHFLEVYKGKLGTPCDYY